MSEPSSGEDVLNAESPAIARRLLHIRPKPVRNKHEYTYYEPQDEVESIVREFTRKGDIIYKVRLAAGGTREVSGSYYPATEGRSEGVIGRR